MIETGNNATNGFFLDKPALMVDHGRGTTDPCAHNVYVSYTTFNGLAQDGKFQSKVNFARSTDNGQTFVNQKIDPPFNQSQGTTIAVDSRPGVPPQGGGQIYVAWRHLFSPHAIIVAKSTNFGASFGPPKQITATPIEAFDQPTISTEIVQDPSQVAFRTTGFPTATVSTHGDSKLGSTGPNRLAGTG